MNPPRIPTIPSMQELLDAAPIRGLKDKVNRSVVLSGVRSFLENLRRDIGSAAKEMGVPSPADLAEKIASWIMTAERPPLRPVINATGILLHPGLGRAPLADDALHEMAAIASGYSNLESDLVTGGPADRLSAVEGLLQRLTDAEAALVVNNNAAATIVVLAGLAAGREVIVSRGQLAEIGEGFRLPDVMELSGARLREVGTTNKTRTADYEAAISDRTAAILRVHSSNFQVVGAAEEASTSELVALARRRNVPLIDDLGSGALIDFSRYGLAGEPVVRESVRQGADLVLFSGDKLLGGPQCGIIVGRKVLVRKIAEHPLLRALRVDKLTLAALAATLRLYLDTDTAETRVPLLSLLATPLENLKLRAERIAEQLRGLAGVASVEVRPGKAHLMPGSPPSQTLDTWCIALQPASKALEQFSAELRQGVPAVVARTDEKCVLFDLRSVAPKHDMDLVLSLVKACSVKS